MTSEQIHLAQQMRAGEPLLPLSRGEGEAQAYRLRTKHGMPYTSIARIMGEYHGIWKGESQWRAACRRKGAPVVRPNNRTPQQRRASA